LEYDAESDTSVIVCLPLTGRSHQLRVHLEWLGHSIVDDVQYGGKSGDESSASKTEAGPPGTAGIDRVLDSIREDTPGAVAVLPKPSGLSPILPTETDQTGEASSFSSITVTEALARAAREVCPACGIPSEGGGGPSSVFGPAQLLQGGHAICLHAHRYSLAFPPNGGESPNQNQSKRRNGSHETNGAKPADAKPVGAGETTLFQVDLEVDPPPWASHLGNDFI